MDTWKAIIKEKKELSDAGRVEVVYGIYLNDELRVTETMDWDASTVEDNIKARIELQKENYEAYDQISEGQEIEL